MSNWIREPNAATGREYIFDGQTVVCSRPVYGDAAEHERIMSLLVSAETNAATLAKMDAFNRVLVALNVLLIVAVIGLIAWGVAP